MEKLKTHVTSGTRKYLLSYENRKFGIQDTGLGFFDIMSPNPRLNFRGDTIKLGDLPVVSVNRYGNVRIEGTVSDFWKDDVQLLEQTFPVTKTDFTTHYGSHLEVDTRRRLKVASSIDIHSCLIEDIEPALKGRLSIPKTKKEDIKMRFAILYSGIHVQGPAFIRFHNAKFDNTTCNDRTYYQFLDETDCWIGGDICDTWNS